MKNIQREVRALIKMTIFILSATSYILTTLPFLPIFYINENLARKTVNKILQFYCKFALWFMGIEVEDNITHRNQEGQLFVCNHLSYIDVLILGAKTPTCFVTSVEIKNTPFLGQLCILGGCLFVERRNKRGLSTEIEEITKALKSGTNVTIFPEATSTNGDEVIRFRRPLFQSSIDAGCEVSPITLNYYEVDQEKLSIKNRDTIFWYDDMTFIDHLWRFFKTKNTQASLTYSTALKDNDLIKLVTDSHHIVKKNYKSLALV